MSPRNSVSCLRHLCLKILSSQLIFALSDDENRYYEVVKNYLSVATCEVLQDLLGIILSSVNVDASIRFSCLELLLRSDVRKLNTRLFPQCYYIKILNVITQRAKRLEHLNLKGVWVRDYPKQLCEVIKKCECLKTLIIPHMANDEVLCVTSALKKLKVLDICGEACFTADGIKSFKSDSLSVLDIGYFGKVTICEEESSGPELVAVILNNLPNLEFIKTYSYTGKALQNFSNLYPSRTTKLKYIHDTGTSLETIDCIIELCPNLENVYLDTPEQGVVEKLSILSKINTLKLTKGSTEDLLLFLSKSGSKIHMLTMNNFKDCCLDLSLLCLLVPELQVLELFKISLDYTNLRNYFMNLQYVEILYCDITDGVVRSILRNAPFLRKLLVGSTVNMTDGDIFRICAESDLACLEELWFSYARYLSTTSVELLMGHCSNLKIIGELTRWDISPEDLELLRIVITLTNTDLIIS